PRHGRERAGAAKQHRRAEEVVEQPIELPLERLQGVLPALTPYRNAPAFAPERDQVSEVHGCLLHLRAEVPHNRGTLDWVRTQPVGRDFIGPRISAEILAASSTPKGRPGGRPLPRPACRSRGP